MSRTGSNGNNGFLSSFTSLFNPSANSAPASNGYPSGKRTAFGGGPSSSTRRGLSEGLSDEAAWSLPYSYQSRQSKASTLSADSQYPPSRGNSIAFESSTTVNMTGQPFNQSTATLVPAQGRPSVSLNSNVSFPSTAYPPLKHTWKRIRSWCDTHYSELGDTLNWPATETQIEDLELTIGYTLPTAIRDSYLCYDGQELESNNSCSDGLFFGLPLLSLEQIAEEWRFWRSVDDDDTTGANPEVKGWMSSCPAGWIRSEYSCRGWIPLITDRVGNYIGVDLSPNPQGGGSPGQVILFGRDFDTKIVLWRGEGEGGWGRFLQYVAEELEAGESWTLEDTHSTDSNDEEDTIGYESYFSNGGAGASRGGGDQGGDGGIGFKLRGEYKGWPVLEAWADRSVRCWEEVGLSASQAPWQKDPPSVLINEGIGSPDAEAEASGSTPRIVPTTVAAEEGQSHPLDSASTEMSSKLIAEITPPSSTLSPPLASARNKQKRRDDLQWQQQQPPHSPLKNGMSSPIQGQGQGQARKKMMPPPAPAGPLDLPTIDDVRAAHAAAMASQLKSGTYHYDVERARPPPGMGGSGMGMGMASTAPRSTYQTRYAVRQTSAQRDSSSNLPRRENDGVELENRSSMDALQVHNTRDVSYLSQDRGMIDHLASSPVPSPRVSASNDEGKDMYPTGKRKNVASVAGPLGNLIDAASSLDLNDTSRKPKSSLDGVMHAKDSLDSAPSASQKYTTGQDATLANDNRINESAMTSA